MNDPKQSDTTSHGGSAAAHCGEHRVERDLLGELAVPEEALHGIHTARAMANFPIAGRPIHPELVKAFGVVKHACAATNQALGVWDGREAVGEALVRACREMADGALTSHVTVDLLQGGAGTSTNMNVNEVLANRALELLNESRGAYDIVSQLDDANRHQSTNDTYPTALKLAAIRLLHTLEDRVVALQEAFQTKEREFAHIVKVGRTQLQDAVLTTLGREMAAYAEAVGRDRWRIYKCEERLRVVNLGGTAIGTGLAAPRQYVFQVVDTLRDLTGIGFARAENLIDATQNQDVFVEVSGILKACAVSLLKVCTDLRLMASGPQAGLGEIRLPARQAGSSIMPGKVNPVIPEAVSQVAMMAMGHDQTIALACAQGNLELNAFLPLVAACLLDSCDLLARGCDILRHHCIEGLAANEARCREHVEASTATVTALLPVLGYEGACDVVRQADETGKSIRAVCVDGGLVNEATFDELISPEAVCRLGTPPSRPQAENEK